MLLSCTALHRALNADSASAPRRRPVLVGFSGREAAMRQVERVLARVPKPGFRARATQARIAALAAVVDVLSGPSKGGAGVRTREPLADAPRPVLKHNAQASIEGKGGGPGSAGRKSVGGARQCFINSSLLSRASASGHDNGLCRLVGHAVSLSPRSGRFIFCLFIIYSLCSLPHPPFFLSRIKVII